MEAIQVKSAKLQKNYCKNYKEQRKRKNN